MAALEIEGKIKTKLTPRSGSSARGGWTSQDFVVEYQDGNYPADACITAFGDEKVRDLDRFQVGDAVKVSFNVRAREFNGRWYNDLRMWRISAPGAAPAAGASAPAASGYAPAAGPAPMAPPPSFDDMPAAGPEDDLPF
ncbi:MAG: DUF3127 domain-containing protein [Bacteroidales bacterium]|jgi:hypothetical protein|nr:DUF3127 domain-containing protein [Bacteroidales bacterium]MBR1500458.1 DUF3127 domain-containing protein [Bacteroidales bacterium]MBR1637117.1 DUF3127 domain-containing protein [Bacteroidales bacterium]MBR1894228.1 DUF3127 domain-containing protein [Bacteroidales bacterium]MDY6464669.1 DUF3127 domain-containing protein [Bacteroidales bacterium]